MSSEADSDLLLLFLLNMGELEPASSDRSLIRPLVQIYNFWNGGISSWHHGLPTTQLRACVCDAWGLV